MILKATRTIDQGVIRSEMTIDSFDNEEEKDCLLNYPVKISYANMNFTHYAKVTNHRPTISSLSSMNSDRVSFLLGDGEYKVDENFCISYAVDVADLVEKVEQYSYIPDEICLGKIMIMIWEDTIKEEIYRQMYVNRDHADDFEGEQFYNI